MTDLMLYEKEQNSWKENFIEPHYIEELDCDGLTAADIAKSLGIEARVVRQKLIKRDFMDRIKTQGFQVRTNVMTNDSNGLDFTEVYLDVQAAKFFVGKYDNLAGDAYLAFLLKLEQRVDEFNAEVGDDPVILSLSKGIRLRQMQMQQERRIREQESKTSKLEVRASSVEEALLDSQLSQVQKSLLKASIDARAKSLGNIAYAGAIQRDLKERFCLNQTNDKWYHLSQRYYEQANNFVGRWGY